MTTGTEGGGAVVRCVVGKVVVRGEVVVVRHVVGKDVVAAVVVGGSAGGGQTGRCALINMP